MRKEDRLGGRKGRGRGERLFVHRLCLCLPFVHLFPTWGRGGRGQTLLAVLLAGLAGLEGELEPLHAVLGPRGERHAAAGTKRRKKQEAEGGGRRQKKKKKEPEKLFKSSLFPP